MSNTQFVALECNLRGRLQFTSWSAFGLLPHTLFVRTEGYFVKTNIDLFGTNLDPALDIVAMSQLGAAVVLLWPTLPAQGQAKLLELIPHLSGIPTVPNAVHRLLDLIERNKPSFP